MELENKCFKSEAGSVVLSAAAVPQVVCLSPTRVHRIGNPVDGEVLWVHVVVSHLKNV